MLSRRSRKASRRLPWRTSAKRKSVPSALKVPLFIKILYGKLTLSESPASPPDRRQRKKEREKKRDKESSALSRVEKLREEEKKEKRPTRAKSGRDGKLSKSTSKRKAETPEGRRSTQAERFPRKGDGSAKKHSSSKKSRAHRSVDVSDGESSEDFLTAKPIATAPRGNRATPS